jgi:hypothetical protein
VIERCRVLKDVSREEAGRIARIGQMGALALLALAVVVVVFGGRLLTPAQVPAPRIQEAAKVEPAAPEGDLPAVLTKRAETIARNLAQLGNRPKPPPPQVPESEPEDGTGGMPEPMPPPATDLTIAYLGMFGSGANPMAVVSVDAKQQVVSRGQTIKHNGEDMKVVKIEREKIEIERRVGNKIIDLAPRTTTSYTSLSGAAPAPGANPQPGGIMPAQHGRRPVVESIRAPGVGRPRPPMNEGSPGGAATDEGVPQR